MDPGNSRAKQESELDYWLRRFIAGEEIRWDGSTEETQAVFHHYCRLLGIDADSFDGKVVADIGCGPLGTLHLFKARVKFGVDILARSYAILGASCQDMIYIAAPAEDLPFQDETLDAIVSVNALDHVDDFPQAIAEIHRVLKTGGEIRLALNLGGDPTLNEPQRLTRGRIDEALRGRFSYNELAYYSEGITPGGMLVLVGKRNQGPPSVYASHAKQSLDRERRAETTEELRRLHYALEFGADRRIVGQLAAGAAFAEYWRGNARSVPQLALQAFFNRPTFLANIGLWKILILAMLGPNNMRHPPSNRIPQ